MNVTGIVFTNDASLGELTIKRTMASYLELSKVA